ncbi:MAG TPA: hypothetical protein VK570_00650 [Rubrivivax sp.]|nr:hypothetical protein [Rubrivivax sp.]
MQRRKLLAVGAATGVLLTIAGGALGLLRPVRVDGRFTAISAAALAAVAQSVLEGFLPVDPAARAAQLQAHLNRLQATIAGFAPAMQGEVDELLAMLAHPAGRLALLGLRSQWEVATALEVHAAMRALQTSSSNLRQQVFHALRDLTNAAYFADSSTWVQVGYPGPRPV